jgi:hypothetical protein
MSIQTKSVRGYLLEKDSKEILTEAMVDISLISPSNPVGKPRIKGTIITKGFKPQLSDESYILKLDAGFSGSVRITIKPIHPLRDVDPTITQFDVLFEDSVWYTSLEWFESL